MSEISPVAIVGAGPYGLSLAAHLKEQGIAFRIFGSPMHNWKNHMPSGMHLKSDGFASNLYDPGSTFTLRHYCAEAGIPYADQGLPVSLRTFTAYGLEFQRRFVPQLEDREVAGVEALEKGFLLRLADGETCRAARVVIAVGIAYFRNMPSALAGLPEAYATHSFMHREPAEFKGRDVVIVGAGASAIDLGYLLRRAGASVRMVSRGPRIRFHVPSKSALPAWLERIRRPKSGLGPGWRSRFCTDAPQLFRMMPGRFRRWVVRRHLGPSPGWFVKETDLAEVPLLTESRLTRVQVQNGRVHLWIARDGDAEQELVTDHVIAATGYKPDLHRLPLLRPALLSKIRSDAAGTPILSAQFESSVRGLYFVGLLSANTFGPMLRFAYGAGFASRTLARHLQRVGCANRRQTERGLASHTQLEFSSD